MITKYINAEREGCAANMAFATNVNKMGINYVERKIGHRRSNFRHSSSEHNSAIHNQVSRLSHQTVRHFSSKKFVFLKNLHCTNSI